MKKHLLTFVIFFIAISPFCKAQEIKIPEEVKENIISRVENEINTGIVVGVITSDGMTYYSYGVKSLKTNEVVDENSVFEIGSISKTFTGILLADKGYHSGRELKACEKLGVTTFLSPKESSSIKKNPDFAMESFVYDKQDDTYTCPVGEIMHTNGKWYNKNLNNGRKSYQVKHYKTKSCNGCYLRTQCTINKHGRLIERTEYQEYVTRNNDKVNQNPDYYRQRQQIIEHQFGTLKRHWHFDYVLTKGKEKVLGEVYLIFTGYNLKRLISIFGFETLMSKMKAHLLYILRMIHAFFTKIKPFYKIIAVFNPQSNKIKHQSELLIY